MSPLVPNTPPQDQFTTDVLPPYDEYMANKSVEWKAKAAADAVAHFSEHVYEYYKYHDPFQVHGANTAEKYVYNLADNNNCPELAVIWEFSLAVKHRFVTRPGPGGRTRLLSTIPTATGLTMPNSFGSTEAFISDSGTISDTGETRANNGRLLMRNGRYFDDVIERAVTFWQNRLPNMPTYS